MQYGDFEIHFLTDGHFKLDGGAMFGIVPKALWAKERQPDERNRITLSTNCPLIRTGKENILIDCGLGRKWTEKQREIYDIDPRPQLIEQLAGVGLKPSDITMILHTHLHLDHAGWSTQMSADRMSLEPVFPNARHLVEKRELANALDPNEVTQGTYLLGNIAPITAIKGWDVFEDVREVVPGITMFRTGGHTEGHCCVIIESLGHHALFISEMMPTTSHLRLPWIMAYDNYPMDTLRMKRTLIAEAVRNNTLVLLNHDPNAFAVRLREVNEKVEFEKVF